MVDRGAVQPVRQDAPRPASSPITTTSSFVPGRKGPAGVKYSDMELYRGASPRSVNGLRHVHRRRHGHAPAILLMFYTLKDYTYPKVERPFFDDRKVFFMLAVGHGHRRRHVRASITSCFRHVISLLVFALLFAVLEEMIKLVILNMPPVPQEAGHHVLWGHPGSGHGQHHGLRGRVLRADSAQLGQASASGLCLS